MDRVRRRTTWDQIPPRRSRWFLDSNCFGSAGGFSKEDIEVIHELRRLAEDESWSRFDIVIPGICHAEIQKGPKEARALAANFLMTVSTNDNQAELIKRLRLRIAMRGDAKPGKHDADADAFFETAKYCGDIFVTNDARFDRLRGLDGIDVINPEGAVKALQTDSWDYE